MLFHVFSREIFFFDIPSTSFWNFPGSPRSLSKNVQSFLIIPDSFSFIFTLKRILSVFSSLEKSSVSFFCGSSNFEESSVACTVSSSSSLESVRTVGTFASAVRSGSGLATTTGSGTSSWFTVSVKTGFWAVTSVFALSGSKSSPSVSSSSGGHNLTSNSLNHSTRPDTSACS